MAFEKILLCDSCGNQINHTESNIPNGFAFVGNVHVVDSEQEDGVGGGLIGNNLKQVGQITSVVNTTHMCVGCTLDAMLGNRYKVKISNGGVTLDY